MFSIQFIMMMGKDQTYMDAENTIQNKNQKATKKRQKELLISIYHHCSSECLQNDKWFKRTTVDAYMSCKRNNNEQYQHNQIFVNIRDTYSYIETDNQIKDKVIKTGFGFYKFYYTNKG